MLKETVYAPAQKFNELISPKIMLKDLKEAGFLGKQLFIRDVKGMFRQSFLGILWAFVPPFLTAAIWIFLNKSGAVNLEDTGMPYPIYVMLGSILFSTFKEALNSPFSATSAGKSMMSKLNFPREAFLISTFYKIIFNFGFKLIALLIIALILKVNFTVYTLLFPLGVFLLILFGMSLGIILIPFQMLLQDFSRIITIVMQLLMYVTPVMYVAPKEGVLRIIMKINPLTEFINIPRFWFTGTHSGNIHLYITLIGVSCVFLLIGWVMYRITMPIVVERVGA